MKRVAAVEPLGLAREVLVTGCLVLLPGQLDTMPMTNSVAGGVLFPNAVERADGSVLKRCSEEVSGRVRLMVLCRCASSG